MQNILIKLGHIFKFNIQYNFLIYLILKFNLINKSKGKIKFFLKNVYGPLS